jgi:RNA polymerase sigma factor (sigma-70 family)
MRRLTPEEQQLAGRAAGLASAALDDLIRHPYVADLARRFGLADLKAEGCLAICRAAPQYDPGRGPVGGYFFRVARNRLMIVLGLYKQRQRWPEPLTGALAARPSHAAPGPDELAALQGALDRLPPRLAWVLRRRLEGWTFQQIGQGLGVRRQRVGQLVAAAVRRLRTDARLRRACAD